MNFKVSSYYFFLFTLCSLFTSSFNFTTCLSSASLQTALINEAYSSKSEAVEERLAFLERENEGLRSNSTSFRKRMEKVGDAVDSYDRHLQV